MTTTAIQSSPTLNPAQLHLLHLFSKKMSETELKELKMLLVEWYDQRAQEIMETIWQERGPAQKTMDELLEMPLIRTAH